MSASTKIISLFLITLLGTVMINAFNGQATYYAPGLGACGQNNGGNDLVAALNAPQFDPSTPNGNPNRNSLCNRQVRVNGPKGSVNVKIVDRCPGCRHGDLDLSPEAFRRINGGSLTAGRINMNWNWA